VSEFNSTMTIKKTQKYTFFSTRPELPIGLFLVISILYVYWHVRNFSFVNFDDQLYVTGNYYVQSGLTFESIRWAFKAVHASNWHPLTWLSHMLDCQIYGMNPGHHHMTNVLFHILNALLLFCIFKRISGSLWKSAFIAAMFALHPLHVESVAWVAERKDVLSTFFWMLTLWSYAGYVESSSLYKYLLLILFYILGLMTKPMLVTLPFVLLLLDYWPLMRFHLKSSDGENPAIKKPFYFGLIWEKIPLFLLSFASSIVTYFVQKSSGAVNSLDVVPFHVRIANALVSYVSYIGKMFWPHNLAVLYPYQMSIAWWKMIGAVLLLMMISVFVFRMFKSKPYLAVGWLWYLGTLVPVMGFVQVGSQAMADRYTYVPLIGIFIMITWGTSDWVLKRHYRKIVLFTASVIILSILVITSRLQVKYWSDSVTLFEHAVNVTSGNSTAQLNLGEALAMKDNIGKEDLSRAVKHYLEAIKIRPGYAKAYNNLGVILADHNNVDAAIVFLSEALQISPGYAGAHFNLGKILSNQNDFEKAIYHYQKALQFDPHMIQALYHLSWILSTQEDEKYRNGKEAVKLATKLCKITQFRQPLALDALAAAYAETGKFNEAIFIAKKAHKMALVQGPATLAQGLEQRLKLYRNKMPYRQALSGKRIG
jgi:tetratricopeptide (TPR) repeat protein